MSVFEYDPAKSAANRAKHGIDFDEAQALWLDDGRVERSARQGTGEEPRSLLIACLGGRMWTAVTTGRGENIRIISVRRSRDEEVGYHADQQRR